MPLEEFEALFEVGPAVLLQFVVDLSRAGTGGSIAAEATVASVAAAITANGRWRRHLDLGWPEDKCFQVILTVDVSITIRKVGVHIGQTPTLKSC